MFLKRLSFVLFKFLQGRFLDLVDQFQNIHWSGKSTSMCDSWSTKYQLQVYKIFQPVEEFSGSF